MGRDVHFPKVTNCDLRRCRGDDACSVERPEQIDWTDNGNSLKGLQPSQVEITGDDEVCLSGDGTFEHPIVGLIFNDDVQCEVRRNDRGHSDEKFEETGDLRVSPIRL